MKRLSLLIFLIAGIVQPNMNAAQSPNTMTVSEMEQKMEHYTQIIKTEIVPMMSWPLLELSIYIHWLADAQEASYAKYLKQVQNAHAKIEEDLTIFKKQNISSAFYEKTLLLQIYSNKLKEFIEYIQEHEQELTKETL